jgi:hypothetical protein
MNPVDAFTILKGQFMTPALQVKSDIFDELGCYSTGDFVYLDKEHVIKVIKIVDDSETMKFKPLQVTYLLSLIDWLVEYSFSFAWTYLVLRDFTKWRRNARRRTPVLYHTWSCYSRHSYCQFGS